jgi:hypothetical protein
VRLDDQRSLNLCHDCSASLLMPRAFALRYGRGCFGVYGEMVMRLMRVKRLNGEQVQASRARVACYEHEVMEFVPGEECLCCARNWRSFPDLTQSLSSLSGEGRNGLTPHYAASHLQVKAAHQTVQSSLLVWIA